MFYKESSSNLITNILAISFSFFFFFFFGNLNIGKISLNILFSYKF